MLGSQNSTKNLQVYTLAPGHTSTPALSHFLVLHLQVLHSRHQGITTLELEFASTNLGTARLPPRKALCSLLVRQSIEFGPELGVVVLEVAVAAELLIELLRWHVVAEVLVELELLLGLSVVSTGGGQLDLGVDSREDR